MVRFDPRRCTRSVDAAGLTVMITPVGEDRPSTDTDSVRMTSDRVLQTANGILFEGNVRLELHNGSITTTRAVATQTPEGTTILSMDDATLISLE